MNVTPTPDEQDIKSALEQLSRDDMQALIQRMVQQHPDLAGLIVSKQSTATRKPRAPFADLRERNARLPALKDEMAKAKL